MTYSEVLRHIFQANHKMPKINLFKMEQMTAHFDHPQKKFKSVHVAGTNGKGSTATKIAKGLELSGYRCGLFTSPHISSFRERIQINGTLIDECSVINFFKKLQKAEQILNIKLSFFELTTMIGFLYFAQNQVDWAVVEVGLGGRLDATNVIQPNLSIITSISIEHSEILGHTVEAIAQEKGGIIKPGTAVIIGPKVPLNPIEQIVQATKSKLIQVKGSYTTFDEENNSIAERAMQQLQLTRQVISHALKVKPFCRMQEVTSPQFSSLILDVAHNPDGLTALFRSLPENYGKPSVILGLSATKNIPECLRIAIEHAGSLYFVQGTAKGASVSLLAAHASEIKGASFLICNSLMEALEKAPPPIVICGTFYIMSAARIALGLSHPID